MVKISRIMAGRDGQEAIRAKCFHQSGKFVEFTEQDVERSITVRFNRIAAKYSRRIAVKSKDVTLTYKDLNDDANRVAAAILNQRGSNREPIILLLGQSVRSIAAILGVLKAGGSYVPLDPTYPRARLSSILQNSQSRFILTDRKNFCLAKDLTDEGSTLLNVDELDPSSAPDNFNPLIPPDAIACIFYTSGSTGQPKGVIQSHRNVLNRVMIDTNSFHICSDDHLSLLSSPSYSVSLRNLYGALLNGATVCPFDIEKDGLQHLASCLIEEKITVLFSVPSVFRHFLDIQSDRKQFKTVRLIYLAGEATTQRDVILYKQHFSPKCILVNSLASNETGIIRQFFIDKTSQIPGDVVPAGYEVYGKQIIILDENGQEVDCNQVGQIVVKSRYLSPGYWHNPDLTTSAFLADPQGGTERIYLTGDMGRLLLDDCLEYLGRNDTRVKIRGSRVELGDLEASLRSHPLVKDAAVVAQVNQLGEKHLVAYLVTDERRTQTIEELRNYLRSQCPNIMIPSRFECLDALPLTPNGKVDRRALSELDAVGHDLAKEYKAPSNDVERVLAQIWSEVLGLERAGIHDDFFELGGHSLLAARLMSRIRYALQLDLPIRQLFEHPTIAQLSTVILDDLVGRVTIERMAKLYLRLSQLSSDRVEQLLSVKGHYLRNDVH